MDSSSDGNAARRARYVVPQALPGDLETALTVAFSTLPRFGQSTEAESRTQFGPVDPVVLRDVTAAVVTFATALKDAGESPQNVLIELKTVLRQVMTRTPRDIGASDELQRIVVLTAIKSYFGGTDPVPAMESADAPDDAGDGAPPAAALKQRPRQVLVVDDDPDARFILSTYLKDLGFEVVVAHDGRAGLDIARRLRPVLVLLDIGVPQIDGRDVIRVLKADPETRHIPVVAVSGLHMLADSPHLVSDGFANVIIKPVRRVEILRTVREAVGAP